MILTPHRPSLFSPPALPPLPPVPPPPPHPRYSAPQLAAHLRALESRLFGGYAAYVSAVCRLRAVESEHKASETATLAELRASSVPPKQAAVRSLTNAKYALSLRTAAALRVKDTARLALGRASEVLKAAATSIAAYSGETITLRTQPTTALLSDLYLEDPPHVQDALCAALATAARLDTTADDGGAAASASAAALSSSSPLHSETFAPELLSRSQPGRLSVLGVRRAGANCTRAVATATHALDDLCKVALELSGIFADAAAPETPATPALDSSRAKSRGRSSPLPLGANGGMTPNGEAPSASPASSGASPAAAASSAAEGSSGGVDDNSRAKSTASVAARRAARELREGIHAEMGARERRMMRGAVCAALRAMSDVSGALAVARARAMRANSSLPAATAAAESLAERAVASATAILPDGARAAAAALGPSETEAAATLLGVRVPTGALRTVLDSVDGGDESAIALLSTHLEHLALRLSVLVTALRDGHLAPSDAALLATAVSPHHRGSRAVRRSGSVVIARQHATRVNRLGSVAVDAETPGRIAARPLRRARSLEPHKVDSSLRTVHAVAPVTTSPRDVANAHAAAHSAAARAAHWAPAYSQVHAFSGQASLHAASAGPESTLRSSSAHHAHGDVVLSQALAIGVSPLPPGLERLQMALSPVPAHVPLSPVTKTVGATRLLSKTRVVLRSPSRAGVASSAGSAAGGGADSAAWAAGGSGGVESAAVLLRRRDVEVNWAQALSPAASRAPPTPIAHAPAAALASPSLSPSAAAHLGHSHWSPSRAQAAHAFDGTVVHEAHAAPDSVLRASASRARGDALLSEALAAAFEPVPLPPPADRVIEGSLSVASPPPKAHHSPPPLSGPQDRRSAVAAAIAAHAAGAAWSDVVNALGRWATRKTVDNVYSIVSRTRKPALPPAAIPRASQRSHTTTAPPPATSPQRTSGGTAVRASVAFAQHAYTKGGVHRAPPPPPPASLPSPSLARALARWPARVPPAARAAQHSLPFSSVPHEALTRALADADAVARAAHMPFDFSSLALPPAPRAEERLRELALERAKTPARGGAMLPPSLPPTPAPTPVNARRGLQRGGGGGGSPRAGDVALTQTPVRKAALPHQHGLSSPLPPPPPPPAPRAGAQAASPRAAVVAKLLSGAKEFASPLPPQPTRRGGGAAAALPLSPPPREKALAPLPKSPSR